MATKLSWDRYHAIGKRFAPYLENNFTYDEIGVEMDCTHQQAWHQSMVALGKLVVGLADLNLIRIRK